jgi:hypothetical protein
MPCTWSLGTLSAENKAAYDKLAKVWTPSGDSKDPFMIDTDKLAAEQAKEQAALKAAREAEEAKAAVAAKDGEDAEVEELQRMLASGAAQSKRDDRPVAVELG